MHIEHIQSSKQWCNQEVAGVLTEVVKVLEELNILPFQPLIRKLLQNIQLLLEQELALELTWKKISQPWKAIECKKS